jgi:hypothetical protein
MLLRNVMKMKNNMLALALTALIGSGVGGVLWWDAQRQAPVKESAAPSKSTPEAGSRLDSPTRDNTTVLRREATPPENGPYRCQGPSGVLYQAEPCPDGTKQAAVAGGSVSVVSPPPVSVAQHTPPTRQSGTRPVGLIERTPPDSKGNEYQCEQLEKQIKRIDAEGRRGGTSWRMEQLREDRRRVKDAMWRLGCGR